MWIDITKIIQITDKNIIWPIKIKDNIFLKKLLKWRDIKSTKDNLLNSRPGL
jgi:hypothetical protein